jgi:hypothetical protein
MAPPRKIIHIPDGEKSCNQCWQTKPMADFLGSKRRIITICQSCRADRWHGEKIRAILCRSCNLAEGFVKSSPVRARQLAEYIERHIPKLRLA